LRPPHTVVADITLPTSEALCKAMAKEPRERFASYDEFIMALTAARSQLLIRQFAPQAAVEDDAASRTSGGKSWWRR
jgi:hypothetical protein